MVDPRMPSDPVEPPYAGQGRFGGWLLAELWDHLWPWSRAGFARSRSIQSAGLALAVAASTVWVLAALGQVAAGVLIGWWFGWSVFEVRVRMDAKPYVKEGPWWGRRYRRANLMDMVCYVSFKNLLIGASLFIALKSAGVLSLP
ncbi:MAG: transcription regulator [Rhodocyclaceae bacterium]|nr:transcription regulator [Rhodocyclaceae bacterium]